MNNPLNKILSKNPSSELILIGQLGRTRGVKGDIYFYPVHYSQCSLLADQTVYLSKLQNSVTNEIPRKIQSFKKMSDKYVVHFCAVDTIEAASQDVNFYVFLSRAQFPPLQPGEIYLTDLLGMQVKHDVTHEVLGKIVGHYQNGALQSIFVIEQVIDGKKTSFELPYIPQVFFKRIAWDELCCYVYPPQYED